MPPILNLRPAGTFSYRDTANLGLPLAWVSAPFCNWPPQVLVVRVRGLRTESSDSAALDAYWLDSTLVPGG